MGSEESPQLLVSVWCHSAPTVDPAGIWGEIVNLGDSHAMGKDSR